jgi:hypothetical protein
MILFAHTLIRSYAHTLTSYERMSVWSKRAKAIKRQKSLYLDSNQNLSICIYTHINNMPKTDIYIILQHIKDKSYSLNIYILYIVNIN